MIRCAAALTRKSTNRSASGLVLARREHRRARDVRDRADVAAREVVERAVDRARADLEPEAVPVVLVDDPGGDVAPVDGRDHRLVVLVELARSASARRARSSAAALPSLAITAPTSGGKSESVGAIATFPFHCGCARSRIDFGSCGGREQRRVVDEAAHPQRHADPVAGRRVVLGRDLGEGARHRAWRAARAARASSARASSRRCRRRPASALPS